MSLTFVPETMDVELYQGDDRRRWKELVRKIDEAAADVVTGDGRPKRMSDTESTINKDAMRAAAIEADEFAREARPRAIIVTVSQVDKNTWRLVREGAGPPREGWPSDQKYGVNVEALSDLLVPEAIVKITQGDTEEPTSGPEFDAWIEMLPPNDFGRIFSAAFKVNTESDEDALVPKETMSSTVSQMLVEISRSQEGSG